MSDSTQIVPEAIIMVLDNEPLIIGGSDTGSIIEEINFYTSLNSFSINADLTIQDYNNDFLNLSSELNGTTVTLVMYEVPSKFGQKQKISETDAVKLFQKTFSIDHVEVLKFGAVFPQLSTIKLVLTDHLESIFMNKLVCYSNFNLKWSSKEMMVEPTIHKLIQQYENVSKPMTIPEKLFGVPKSMLKRRFTTDRSSTMLTALNKYIDALYNTRWYEYLTNSEQKMEIPKCILAYTNLYSIDGDGGLVGKPWLTSANLLDTKPNMGIYSLPYEDTGKLLDYAKKDYNISIEDTSIDLRGGPFGSEREKVLAIGYRKHKFNPKNGTFQDDIKELDDLSQYIPTVKQNIETTQNPKYFGIGQDPSFAQIDNFSKSLSIDYTHFIRDNMYYFSSGSNSFYKDACSIIMKPLVYVSIPFSGWHSPGQEIDLRMISADYDLFEPDKSYYFSLNKLISGRWKIINSVTTLRRVKDQVTTGGFTPIETVGLTRAKYFRGNKPK